MAEGCILNAGATASASFSIASPGLETVSGPLVGAPRCWTTCASSWAIRRSPSDVFGLVLVLREVDVRAGRERARGDGVVEVVARSSRCVRGHPRGRRGTARAARRRRCRAPVPLPRVESIVDCTLGWTSPVGMIPAPCVRAIAPPNAWLPTLETNSLEWALPRPPRVSGLCSGARGFSCSWMRSGSAHTGEDTGARVRARKGRFGRPFVRACMLDARHVECHRKPAQSVDPRDHRGLAAPLDAAARRRRPAGSVAQARARRRRRRAGARASRSR